jgi:hypothetical protein
MTCPECTFKTNCIDCSDILDICRYCCWSVSENKCVDVQENRVKCVKCNLNPCEHCGNDIPICSKCKFQKQYICNRCNYSTLNHQYVTFHNDNILCETCAEGVFLKDELRCEKCGLRGTNYTGCLSYGCNGHASGCCPTCTDIYAQMYCYECY